jgi:hypothetical protein
MERRRIVGSLAAAGMVVVGLVMPLTLMPSSARANDDGDWEWNTRCDRGNVLSEYCQRQRQDQDWRDRDGRDRDWNDRDWSNNNDRWNRRSDRSLRSGTVIQARVERNRRIVLRRNEEYPLRLRVTDDVRSSYRGRVVIPEDSIIEGELVPYRDGYRFEADEIRLRNGRTRDLNAVSSTIYGDDDDWRDRDDDRAGGILNNGTLISSAAAIILQSILGGSLGSGRIGGLGGLGGLGGGVSSSVLGGIFDRNPRARRELAVIYPKSDLDLRLTREFNRD